MLAMIPGIAMINRNTYSIWSTDLSHISHSLPKSFTSTILRWSSSTYVRPYFFDLHIGNAQFPKKKKVLYGMLGVRKSTWGRTFLSVGTDSSSPPLSGSGWHNSFWQAKNLMICGISPLIVLNMGGKFAPVIHRAYLDEHAI